MVGEGGPRACVLGGRQTNLVIDSAVVERQARSIWRIVIRTRSNKTMAEFNYYNMVNARRPTESDIRHYYLKYDDRAFSARYVVDIKPRVEK